MTIGKKGVPKLLKGEVAVLMHAVARLREAGVPFFHCPNEGDFPAQYRAKLAAKGLSSGVPDLIIVQPAFTGHRGAVLELKSLKGRVTPDQLEWLERWDRVGWATAVTKGHVATAMQLLMWGYIKVTAAQEWIAHVEGQC